MDTLQTWIVVGVPCLLVAAAMVVGRSNRRAWVGYAVLLAGVLTFVLVPRDAFSAAVLGLGAFALVAGGRGQHDDDVPEHHEGRRRFTVAQR